MAYPLVFLVVITIEMADNGAKYHTKKHDRILFTVAERNFNLYDLKLDSMTLLAYVTISLLVFVALDRNKSFFYFGLQPVARHLHLNLSELSEKNGSTFRSEDSLLLLWIINLSFVTYVSFFVWDGESSWKAIPSGVMFGCVVLLIYRESRITVLKMLLKQLHTIVWLLSIVIMWIVTVTAICMRPIPHSTVIISDLLNTFTYSIGMLLFISMDSFVLSSTSFLLRGTLPMMFIVVSGLCYT
ncbi:hypothetical protein RFI_12168 [Reticulomyxa filosa]|uniref:Uncharacterized protein n=1 Tax=Reticulomyxa filosa TaxID=46433 RepID=X6NG68_RETFI|nr:hypothetical protein RFI_12168 [Reticulomyxa filosa]|eukprot:ETO24966.1 hypothetical protein RFI_12168 [Reticulomyxa filosa]